MEKNTDLVNFLSRWLVVAYCIENLILSLPTLYTCIKLVTRSNYVTPLDVEVHVHNAAYAVLFLSPGKEFFIINLSPLKMIRYYGLNNKLWLFHCPLKQVLIK